MRRLLSLVLPPVLILVLLGCVLYGGWLNHLARGEEAFDEGRYGVAREHFQRAWSGWEQSLLPGFVVDENRVRAALNLVQVDYRLGEYQRGLEFLRQEGSLPEQAAYHFWTGNLLVSKALEDMDQTLLETLARSRESYLQALQRDPEYWDATYNYEYVSAILESLESGESHAEEDVQILLEKMRTDIQRNRRELPPEERK